MDNKTTAPFDWKIFPALLPGALLGAGAGALIGAFEIASGSPAANLLQTAGIILMLGSIVLRLVLNQGGIRLSDYGGLLFNSICTFLTGLVVAVLLRAMLVSEGGMSVIGAVVVIGLSWIPALALTVLGFVLSAPLRARVAAARNQKS